MSLVKRLLTSAVLLSITFWVIFYGGTFWFTVEVLLFVGIALFEFFTLMKESKMPVYRLFGVVMGMVIPAVVYFEQGTTQSGEILFLVLGCLFVFLIQFSKTNNSEALIGIALTLFGLLYVSWFLSFLIKIRFLDHGVIWIVYLVVVTKMADVGAYTVGRLIGRHRLIVHISPNKSTEGFFGGILFSVVMSLFLGRFLPVTLSVPHLVVLGTLLSVLGQIGDLSESLMKRFCNVKDSGKALPGMGGVLDIVDSILFTAPIFYFHLKTFA